MKSYHIIDLQGLSLNKNEEHYIEGIYDSISENLDTLFIFKNYSIGTEKMPSMTPIDYVHQLDVDKYRHLFTLNQNRKIAINENDILVRLQ